MCKKILDWRTAHNLTQAEAAALVHVKQAAWSKWENGQVPPEQCLAVHRITGVALHLLRPDIYPVPQRRESDRKPKERA